MELAAADAVDALAAELALALDEYHAEIEDADDVRESSVVEAFVTRTRQDADDAAALEAHADAFRAAFARPFLGSA